jgi:small subunit ribosomal protein S21
VQAGAKTRRVNAPTLQNRLFCCYKHLILEMSAVNARSSCRIRAALFIFSAEIRAFAALCTESSGVTFFMQIMVRDNNVDQALRALKKKLQREGVYREMKLRRHFEKPSEKRAREKAAAIRRARKMERKQQERNNGK